MRHLIGILVLALAACGNGASGEPAASPVSNTGGVEQGALPVGQTTTTGQEQGATGAQQTQQTQSAAGKPLPNAGTKVEAAGPPTQPRVVPTLFIPPAPGPTNTGDPCGPCGPPPGRK
jgi:hypothetical protein